jgi:Glycosyl transferases group 1
MAADVSPETSDRPYFLCVGTIEPRKNHLMLLHLWRRFIALHGDATPRLILVGRRGWENENVLDLLDRCPSLKGHVIELGTVPDTRLAVLLRGARAPLMSSFAEGFGLPVAEALAHGVPVLYSGLPALREAGQAVPEYLDPLDSHAWHDAILHYAADTAPRRAAQCAAWVLAVRQPAGTCRVGGGLHRRLCHARVVGQHPGSARHRPAATPGERQADIDLGLTGGAGRLVRPGRTGRSCRQKRPGERNVVNDLRHHHRWGRFGWLGAGQPAVGT